MKRVKLYNTITAVVSVLVPVVVALLLFLKWTADKLVFDLKDKRKIDFKQLNSLKIKEKLILD